MTQGRYRNPHGATAPRTASPLPQGNPRSKVEAARIVHGFTAYLPGRSRIFFQRQFFSNYPRPIQQGGATPFPRTVGIATIQAPTHQAIVLREVKFAAYQHSGIGIEDLAEVPNGRAVGTLGFNFNLGNRGLTDFQTNLPGRGIPVSYSTVAQTTGSSAPRAGQGNTFQGVGRATPTVDGEQFAAYARPGDIIQAQAVVFRPPSFDLRLFEVKISGWLGDEYEVDKIIDRLTR
jgi:hypothetical protein